MFNSSKSLVEDADAEWRTRKISLFGAVRSFVTQLKPGEELTKVSIPAALLFPFSILEMLGQRELNHFELLLPVNKETDPLQRMIQVARWYVSTVQSENWHKKPYNPILGEMHEVWTDTPEWKTTEFIAEQVSHHPPVSAYYVRNRQEQVSLRSTASFGVKFGNTVAVAVSGSAEIEFKQLNETYHLSRRVPNTMITNVIMPMVARKMYWEGEVVITCAKTNLVFTINFSQVSGDNIMKANITELGQDAPKELVTIDGKCGGVIKMTYTDKPGEKLTLIDLMAFKKPRVRYLPVDELDPMSSYRVWGDTNKYIVENDNDKAEEAKKKVEGDQRKRRAELEANKETHPVKFFEWNAESSMWLPKEDAVHSRSSEYGNSDDSLSSVRSSPNIPIMTPNTSNTATAAGLALDGSPAQTSHAALHNNSPGANGSIRMKTTPVGGSYRMAVSPWKASESDELLDPASCLKSGWLSVRNNMKNWKRRFFVIRPGKMLIFKDDKRVAQDKVLTWVNLTGKQVEDRLTKMDGFSFRIFVPSTSNGAKVYERKGFKGESLKAESATEAILLSSSEDERSSWVQLIQEQINYANKANRRSGAFPESKMLPSNSPPQGDTTHALVESPGMSDFEDEESVGNRLDSQRTTLDALQQQIKVLQSAQLRFANDVDDKFSQLEKRVQEALARSASQRENSSSLPMYIIVVLIAFVAYLWFVRR